MVAYLPKYWIILVCNQFTWLSSAQAEGLRQSSSQLHLDTRSSVTRDFFQGDIMYGHNQTAICGAPARLSPSCCACPRGLPYPRRHTCSCIDRSVHLDTQISQISGSHSQQHTQSDMHTLTHVWFYMQSHSTLVDTHTHSVLHNDVLHYCQVVTHDWVGYS